MQLRKIEKQQVKMRFLLFMQAVCFAMTAAAEGSQEAKLSTQPTTKFGKQTSKPLSSGLNLKMELVLSNSDDECMDEDGIIVTGSPITTHAPAVPTPQVSEDVVPRVAKLDSGGQGDRKQDRETVNTLHIRNNFGLAVMGNDSGVAAQAASIPSVSSVWEITPADKTLNAVLARWAATAGWQLVWELPVDYVVETRTTVHGTFDAAVGTVAKSMESAEVPMKAIFYQGNKVLRIVAKGGE